MTGSTPLNADKPQEPRDLIQICTDIYYECETIKRLDELTDEALDWHNKQVVEVLEKLHDENIQVAYVDGAAEYYEEYIPTDKLRMVITDYEMKINEAERGKLKDD